MSLEDFGISPSDIALILRGFSEGKYHLLCGAGVSYGATGGDGQELRLAGDLASEIATKFALQLDPGEDRNLQIAYEEAKALNSKGLHTFLKNRFVGCMPEWQGLLFQFQWQRIWTLNIDDVLERAFESSPKERLAVTITSCDWKQPLEPRNAALGALQLVYLHGRASDLDTHREGLVFSMNEYAAATKRFDQWHAAFQTMYIQDPVVVCGARLTEEMDFAIATRTTNQARVGWGCPSMIVLQHIGEGQAVRLKRFGLLPVQANAQEFFLCLKKDLVTYEKSQTDISTGLAPGTKQRFLTQFRKLDENGDFVPSIGHSDFYGGDEPTWSDIRSDKDVIFSNVNKALELLRDSSVERYAALIHGQFATGKTTAMLRVAMASIGLGLKPYWFRNEAGIDVEATANYLQAYPSIVLLFDGAADHSERIGRLLTLAKERNARTRIFMSERTYRLRGFRIDIPDEFRREFGLSRLLRADIEKIVGKRRSVARLGEFIRQNDNEVVDYLEKGCHGELIECLSRLEFSEGFRARVRRIVQDGVRDPAVRPLVVAIACVHRFGYALPLLTAMAVGHLPFTKFKELLGAGIGADGPIVREPLGLRLRHRILSEYAWKEVFSQDEKFDATYAVVASLAPLINPAIIGAKEYPHLIVRKVFDQERVSESVGLRALELFEDFEGMLGWNSRYWEQRALLEARTGNFSKAYSYAQKAVSLERHPFAFTSLGTICVNHAVRLYPSNPIDAKALYFEGEEALDKSVKSATYTNQSYEHPFVTFFAGTLKLVATLRADDADRSAVEERWNIWIKRAKGALCFSTYYGRQRIKNLEKDWLRYNLGRAVDPSVDHTGAKNSATTLGNRFASTKRPENDTESSAFPSLAPNLAANGTTEYLVQAVRSVAASDGWANLARVGSFLKSNTPFDYKALGFKQLSGCIQSTNLFEMKTEKVSACATGSDVICVRLIRKR
jgi:hypothetical protein